MSKSPNELGASSTPITIPKPISKPTTIIRCSTHRKVRPYLQSIDLLSSTPPTHTHDLITSSGTIGPIASSFHWMDDSESEVCMCCQISFSIANRRHHCRVCGSLVCESCSPERPCPKSMIHNQPTSASTLRNVASNTWNYFSKKLSIEKSAPAIHQNSSTAQIQNVRVCTNCHASMQQKHVCELYNLMDNVLTLAEYAPCILDCQLWKVFQRMPYPWTKMISIFRQSMAQSQHLVTNPWIHKKRKGTELQQRLQCMLLWANQHHFRNHYIYMQAWQNHQSIFQKGWPHLSLQISDPIQLQPMTCDQLQCRIRCSEHPTWEVQMHMFFMHPRMDHLPSISFELATALMPTVLIRGRKNALYLHMLQLWLHQFGPRFGAPLYFWIKSIVCSGFYIDQLYTLFDKKHVEQYEQSWKWITSLCHILSKSHGKIRIHHFSKIRKCRNILVPGTHNLVFENIQFDRISRAYSSSKPYLVPCTLRNVDTHQISHQTIMVKHKQSVFSDWISMALIKLCTFHTKSFFTDANAIQSYHIIPIGPYSGILKIVPNAYTIYNMSGRKDGRSIFNLLYNAHPTWSVVDIRTQFSRTVAFFTILSCFLGWRDRIASNMMIHPESCSMFHIDFEYSLEQGPAWKDMIRKYLFASKNNQVSGFTCSGEEVTLTPLLPASVLDVLGGEESSFYNSVFKPQCNYFYSAFYQMRHIFYYSTECLCWTPSSVGPISQDHHEAFFQDLEGIFLRGKMLHLAESHPNTKTPISPLIVESTTGSSGALSLDKTFDYIHSFVQGFRQLRLS